MRLWTLHPSLLDRAGLVAGWREGLLAQAVLAGRTRGYTHHPQLTRFRETPDPIAAVVTYLGHLADEADARGYRFRRDRLDAVPGDRLLADASLPVTDGQLAHELLHLRGKLVARDPERLPRVDAHLAEDGTLRTPADGTTPPPVHPLFRVVSGPIADWERA